MIRAVILSATIAALVVMWREQPTPVKVVETPYCVIDYKAAGKDIFGNVVTGWAKGYGPCSLQDKFFEI